MKALRSKIYSAVAAIAVTAIPALATTIGFDDLPSDQPIANGYNGLNWNNFYVYDAVNDPDSLSPSGYNVAVISPNNVAFNGFGTTAVFSNSLFDLNSAYLTAVWRDNLQVEVIGSLLSVPVYDNIYTLSATSPTLINFNYLGIDTVQFSIFSGGTHHQGYNAFDGTQFAIDNLVINMPPPNGHGVPDPGSTAVFLILAFCGFGFLRPELTVKLTSACGLHGI
jgi:hypothetical protein